MLDRVTYRNINIYKKGLLLALIRQLVSMATISNILCSLIFTLLFSSSICLDISSNVLLTGEVLETGQNLMTIKGNSTLTLQEDCNLVLMNISDGKVGFQSDTSGKGVNCALTVDDHGLLVINSEDGSVVWTSNARSIKGKYAAILRPDGVVVVYGPQIWSVPPTHDLWTSGVDQSRLAENFPSALNALFTLQTLNENDRLTNLGYWLTMADCNFKLETWIPRTVTWESGTTGNGEECFLRLDRHGLLTILDHKGTTIWESGKEGISRGDYVLILQLSGEAAVYGPIVWATNYNPPVQAY